MAEVHIVDIDGEQWDIKDLPLTNRINNENKWSTTEIKTSKTWINGKPIYRLVAVCLHQGSTGSTSKYNGVDMTNYNMEQLTHACIIDAGTNLPCNCYEGCIYKVEMQSNKKMVCFFPSGQGWDAVASGNTRYIVVEYTKTTN